MTTRGRPISEEDLHGFVDGLLDPERHAAVQQHLRDDPGAATRIHGWQASRDAMRALHGATSVQPVPAALNVTRLAASRNARRWSPARVAAGLVLALSVGAGMGWFAHAPMPETGLSALGVEAANAHRAFSTGPVEAVEFSPAALPDKLSWIGNFVGHRVVAPDLSASGYRLLGARLVASPQGAGCLFLYDGGALGRVSILMRLMHDTDLNAEMRSVGAAGVSGFAWSRFGLGISLVASGPATGLHALSDHVRDAMAAAI